MVARNVWWLVVVRNVLWWVVERNVLEWVVVGVEWLVVVVVVQFECLCLCFGLPGEGIDCLVLLLRILRWSTRSTRR